MQERQVTIGATTFKLDEPFLVFATQNPIEHEGTYRLPEAQLDRFMFKLLVDYPSKEQEREIIKRDFAAYITDQTLTKDDIVRAQQLVRKIYVDEKIIDYIVNIVFATRMPEEVGLNNIKPYILYGVSPRATLALHHAARAYAFLKRRHFVIPDDVKAVAPAILRHRLVLSYEAEADGITPDHIIQTILANLVTP
jgi:MoxR-like ATPase